MEKRGKVCLFWHFFLQYLALQWLDGGFSKSFTHPHLFFICVGITISTYYTFSPHDVDKMFSY